MEDFISRTSSHYQSTKNKKVPIEDVIIELEHNYFTVSQMSPLINFLPNDKVLDWSKLKAFADDKLNLAEKLKFILGRVENIMGKGENAGYQHFLIFPQCFQKASITGLLKVGIVC